MDRELLDFMFSQIDLMNKTMVNQEAKLLIQESKLIAARHLFTEWQELQRKLEKKITG